MQQSVPSPPFSVVGLLEMGLRLKAAYHISRLTPSHDSKSRDQRAPDSLSMSRLRWARSWRAAGSLKSRGTPTRSRRYCAPTMTGPAGCDGPAAGKGGGVENDKGSRGLRWTYVVDAEHVNP